MAYKLTVIDNEKGFNFNAKYQNLSKLERPSVEAKASNGSIVKERSTYNGQVLAPGSTQRQWVDDQGNVYSKQDLTFWYNGEQVDEVKQTKVFDIQGYQPLNNYTDNYIMDKFYELFPSSNDMKKDFDKKVAESANLCGMHKLWKHLNENRLVARGEFCTSNKGFIASDGYIRAILLDNNKWGLEIGLFKEEKVFEHLNEGDPKEVEAPKQVGNRKLKMV